LEVLGPNQTFAIRRQPREHTVHQDIDKKYLHSVERVAEPKQRTKCDESQCSGSCAELERQEVLDIVKDRFAFETAFDKYVIMIKEQIAHPPQQQVILC
jgi:hypothetical protein